MANFHYVTGTINWAKVLGDPVPNYNRDGHEWTFDFIPSPEALETFKALGIDNKMKEAKDGTKFLRFTQKARRADGKANFPITVVNARNEKWDPETKIGNGSVGEVKFKVVDYGKGKPTGVYPQALRILEFKPYERQEFEPLPEDSKYVQEAPDFSEPAPEDYDMTINVEQDPLEG